MDKYDVIRAVYKYISDNKDVDSDTDTDEIFAWIQREYDPNVDPSSIGNAIDWLYDRAFVEGEVTSEGCGLHLEPMGNEEEMNLAIQKDKQTRD